jgi:hypothetical protein
MKLPRSLTTAFSYQAECWCFLSRVLPRTAVDSKTSSQTINSHSSNQVNIWAVSRALPVQLSVSTDTWVHCTASVRKACIDTVLRFLVTTWCSCFHNYVFSCSPRLVHFNTSILQSTQLNSQGHLLSEDWGGTCHPIYPTDSLYKYVVS